MREYSLQRLFIRYLKRGEADALAGLFDELAPRLMRLASHLVHEADQAEDLVQETFLTAIERAQDYERGRGVESWMVGILVHKALNANRKAARRIDPMRAQKPSGEQDPARRAASVELSRALVVAIAQLPIQHREVLRPYLIEGHAPRDIAEHLGLAPGTVRARIHRGLDFLRRVLPGGLTLGGAALFGHTHGLAAMRSTVLRRAAELPTQHLVASTSALPASLVFGALLIGGLVWAGMDDLQEGPPSQGWAVAGDLSELAGGERVSIASDGQRRGGEAGAPSEAEGSSAIANSTDFGDEFDDDREGGAGGFGPARLIDKPTTSLGVNDPGLRPGVFTSLPPSSIELRGGRTTIGTKPSDIEDLVEAAPSHKRLLRVFDAETPQHVNDVRGFFLAITEVTNEQYAIFVTATGYRPPRDWADPDALKEATRQFLEEFDTKRKAAKAAGKPAPDREIFEQEKWWNDSWSTTPWKVPAGHELAPVTYVSHEDARAYCQWAGLRLPTEFEYQHAVRGSGKAFYPWGDKFEDGKFAATAERTGYKDPSRVATFPKGASREGIFDLTGNVWEWTDSPYSAYPKFAKNTYRIKAGKSHEKITPEPSFRANQRVAVGGSFQGDKYICRATTRRGSERNQRTSALGFRTAASKRAGVDIATAIELEDVRKSDARADNIKYRIASPISLDRWVTRPSAYAGAPKGYEVIEDYDYIVFTPAEEILEGGSSETTIDRESLTNPISLGFLTLSQEMVEPALAPGTYLLFYRAKGKKPREKKDKDEEKGEEEEVEDDVEVESPLESLIDTKQDNIIFLNADTAEFVTALQPIATNVGKFKGNGAFNFTDKVEWEDIPGEKKPVRKNVKWLKLDGIVNTKVTRVGLSFSIAMKPAERVFEGVWRKSE